MRLDIHVIDFKITEEQELINSMNRLKFDNSNDTHFLNKAKIIYIDKYHIILQNEYDSMLACDIFKDNHYDCITDGICEICDEYNIDTLKQNDIINIYKVETLEINQKYSIYFEI